MYGYVSLSTCTRLPSFSALVVSLRVTVDGSFIAVLADSVVTSHLMVKGSSTLVSLGRAGACGACVRRILAQAMRPAIVPAWKSWSWGVAIVPSGTGGW